MTAGRPAQATSGQREHGKVPGSEHSENAYLGECWCQNRGEAWPCTAGRAQGAPQESPQELREEVARWLCATYGDVIDEALPDADRLLALPGLARLADADEDCGCCNACRANAATARRPAVAMAYGHAAEWLRRALGGES